MRPFSVFSAGFLFVFGLSGACFAALGAGPVPGGRPAEDPSLGVVRALLATPEGQVDFARAKVTIDRLIDPSIDGPGTLRQLDAWAATVRARFPAGASKRVKLDILLSTLYKPGPWNQYRPFSYDLDGDPSGEKLSNMLISNYLIHRKGQCISMPTLVLILGQKLGLPVTLATAPKHAMVKYGDEESGHWLNVEATAGFISSDSEYEREAGVTALAIRNEIYLRPLSQREAVALLVTTLMNANEERGNPMPNFKLADAMLEVDPKNVNAMLSKANAFYLLTMQRYKRMYKRESDIPPAIRKDYLFLTRQNQWWGQQAEALGWTAWTAEQQRQYVKNIEREKAKRKRSNK